MQQMINIINSIATPEFKTNYQKLINPSVSLSDKKHILQQWHLVSEMKLLEHDTYIQSKIKNDKKLSRIYYQDMFIKGKRNNRRFNELINTIQN